VKFGAAAFMPTIEKANELAEAMVAMGNECGVNTRALITSMDAPLGRAAGNWLEVKESVRCLDGFGPPDLRELVVDFAAHLLVQTDKELSLKNARERADECLDSGKPREKWDEMLVAQGADIEALSKKLEHDHTAPAVMEVTAAQDGFVQSCDARIIGEVVRDLGGGRLTKETVIQSDVGVDMIATAGDVTSFGSVLCRVHAGTKEAAEAAMARLQGAFRISEFPPEPGTLVHEVIQ
jgi:thymidine phosphorylase